MVLKVISSKDNFLYLIIVLIFNSHMTVFKALHFVSNCYVYHKNEPEIKPKYDRLILFKKKPSVLSFLCITWTIAGVDSMLVGHSSYLLIGLFISLIDTYQMCETRALLLGLLKDLSPKNIMASLR